MKANINNITYIVNCSKFQVVTEFSVMPIDTFNSDVEALQFIEGYLDNRTDTEAARRGELFRNFVEIGIVNGVEYNKVRDLKVARCG